MGCPCLLGRLMRYRGSPGLILQDDFQRFPLDGSVGQYMSLQRFPGEQPGLNGKCHFTDEKMGDGEAG